MIEIICSVISSNSEFTCNRDEISPRDETRPRMKKILFTREFHSRMKQVDFHPRMKFNLKENLPLSMKTYNKIYHFSLICLNIRRLLFQKSNFVHHFCFLVFLLRHFRSSRPEVFCKKGWPATLLKKRLWRRCFPVNFAKFLRTSLLTEHLRWLLLAFPDMVLRNRAKQKLQYQLNYHKMWLK